MIPRSLFFTLVCVLSLWTVEYAAGCGVGQYEEDGQCCALCPPGTYKKGSCSEQRTVCTPCLEGYFSDQPHMFDRCEQCRSCQQEYAETCTPTTNSNCSCRPGFLCSDNVCSKCEENKCVEGEKLNRTASTWGGGLIKYSYQCEPQPSCPDNTYFDARDNICKTRRDGVDSVHLILGIGIVLLSLNLLVFLSRACVKNLRKNRALNVLAVPTSDFHLSKEESGFELILQDESKNSNSFGLQHLENVVLVDNKCVMTRSVSAPLY